MRSVLRFIDYIVDEINFKNKYSENESFKLDFDFDSNVEFKDKNNFILKLNLYLFKKKEEVPFKMNVKVIGIFEIDDVDDNLRMELAEKNAIAILFPYVRALVSNYTAVANISPLILPTINVAKYIEDKKKKIDNGDNIA
jgi:preprotein translocase subunit SecB